MKTTQVAKLTPQERLLYWITERDAIRIRRKQGKPKPWTDDEILQQYRFCNVRRMDDAVSQWLLKNWYEPNYDHPNIVLACALARHINRIEPLEYIGFPDVWCAYSILIRLQEFQEQHGVVFGAAYVITGKDSEMGSKLETVVLNTVDQLRQASITTRTMQDAVNDLMLFNRIGSFMAGQIVADLRWACGSRDSWQDRKRWAPIGPGSRRGIKRLLGHTVADREFASTLMSVVTKLRQNLPKVLHLRLEAIDWQNCLCEFDKYERTLWDEGRPKRNYAGV